MEHCCKLLQLLLIPLLHNHSPFKACYRVPSLYISVCRCPLPARRHTLTSLYAINFGPTEPQTLPLQARMLLTASVLFGVVSKAEIVARYVLGPPPPPLLLVRQMNIWLLSHVKSFQPPQITGQKWSCQILQVDLAVEEY